MMLEDLYYNLVIFIQLQQTSFHTLQTVKYCKWFECSAGSCETCHNMPLHNTHNALVRTQNISCITHTTSSLRRNYTIHGIDPNIWLSHYMADAKQLLPYNPCSAMENTMTF